MLQTDYTMKLSGEPPTLAPTAAAMLTTTCSADSCNVFAHSFRKG